MWYASSICYHTCSILHFPAPLIPSTIFRRSNTTQCSTLKSKFPNQVFLPGSSDYEHDQLEYWTLQQTQLRPSCRLLPETVVHVRYFLDVAIQFNTTLALVSGGHSSNVGASNIQDGITIDLAALSDIELAQDTQSVWLRPGAKWSDVYATLESEGLTVAGGRVGHVGVGGYVLGGGFSWFANQEGWTCDSVIEFEVLTPDLEILYVSSESYADLFWALKGSLGAFGIVTRLRMKTFPNTGFYGGAISFDEDAIPSIFAALKESANNAETELATAGYLSFGYAAALGEWIYNAYLINTANTSNSAAIGDFLMVPNKGHTLRHMTPRESANEIAQSNPLGFRRSKFTLTMLPTMEAMQAVNSLTRDFALDMQLKDEEFFGVTHQPLTVPHLRKQSNIFQILTADYGPLLLVSVELWWKDSSKDERYEREMRGLYEDGLGFGLGWMRVLHMWMYPNYAASWQDALSKGRLGEETMQRLQRVREKYDPDNVWKRLVPGIWHV